MDEISNKVESCTLSLLIGGDFNLIHFPSDKNNTAFHHAEANAFNQTLDDLALIELPLLDRRFTWSNERNTPTLTKIDRMLVSIEWELTYPDYLLQASLLVRLIMHLSIYLRATLMELRDAFGLNFTGPSLRALKMRSEKPGSAAMISLTLLKGWMHSLGILFLICKLGARERPETLKSS